MKNTSKSKNAASRIFIFILALNVPIFGISGNSQTNPDSASGEIDIPVPSSNLPASRNIMVTIYTPPGKIIRGNILVLPGWNHERHRWLNETSLKAQADTYKFRLICPEMNTSLYASEYFPETTLKWSDTPGLKWIQQNLIPALKTRKIFLSSQSNFVLGLSTGGRGAALVTLDNPGMFNAAAALSGDFDQTQMPNDRLMTAVYGSFQKFPERWEKDNPVKMAKNWKTPLYLAHGTKDAVVPPSQTKLFYTVLRDQHLELDVQLKMPEAGHDYKFWDSQISSVLKFFDKYVKQK